MGLEHHRNTIILPMGATSYRCWPIHGIRCLASIARQADLRPGYLQRPHPYGRLERLRS